MLRAIVIGALALLGFLQPAFAEGTGSRLDTILAAGVLKVSSTGDYKPFTFKDPGTGAYEGRGSISTKPGAWPMRSA